MRYHQEIVVITDGRVWYGIGRFPRFFCTAFDIYLTPNRQLRHRLERLGCLFSALMDALSLMFGLLPNKGF
jgi:hypothetical protein